MSEGSLRAHDDLADLARRYLDVMLVEELARRRRRWRGRSCRAAGARSSGVVDRHAGVGRSVGLDQAHTEALLELGCELGHRHSPRQPGRVVRVVGSRLPLVQHCQRGAHEVKHGGTEASDLVPERRHREPLTDRRRRAEHEGRHDREDRGIEVEQRERGVQDVIGAQLEVLDHQLGLAHRVAVREDAALGRAGRSGGEQHHGRIEDGMGRSLGIPVGRRRGLERDDIRPASWVRAATSSPVTTTVRSADSSGTTSSRADVSDESTTACARRGRLQGVHESRTPKRGVDQRRHGAQPAQAQPRHHEVGAVRKQHRHELPTTDPQAGPGRKRPNSTRASVSAKVRSQSAKRKNDCVGLSAARRASKPSRVARPQVPRIRAAGIRASL